MYNAGVASVLDHDDVDMDVVGSFLHESFQANLASDFKCGGVGATRSAVAQTTSQPTKRARGDGSLYYIDDVVDATGEVTCQHIHVLSDSAAAVDSPKVGGAASGADTPMLNLMTELQSLGDRIVEESGIHYMVMGETKVEIKCASSLSIQDLAQMAPLGPDMTTASLIAAVTPEGDVETGVEEPAAWLKWKSEYTEEEMQQCLEEAHKSKQFPSIIEPAVNST
jgi:hypothetical protein